jgi:hypothetical protein
MVNIAQYPTVSGMTPAANLFVLKIQVNRARRTFLQLSISKPPHISQSLLLCQLAMSICHFWFFIELQWILFRYAEKVVSSFVLLCTLAKYSTELYSLCMTLTFFQDGNQDYFARNIVCSSSKKEYIARMVAKGRISACILSFSSLRHCDAPYTIDNISHPRTRMYLSLTTAVSLCSAVVGISASTGPNAYPEGPAVAGCE